MWMLTPTYVVIISLLSWIFFLWGKIWFGHLKIIPNREGNKIIFIKNLLFIGMRGFFFILYSFIGLLLIDLSIRIPLTPIFGYGSVCYIIDPILMSISIGVIYLFSTVFVAPTYKTIISFIAMTIPYIYYSLTSTLLDNLYIPLIYGVCFELVLNLIEILKKTRDKQRKLPLTIENIFALPLYDKSKSFKKMLNIKTYIIVLLLLNIELIIMFEGLTIFCLFKYFFQ
ncbi:MAG: hypothetical protein ACTSRZ_19680 [Promethearchaeota archaeon]